MNLFELSAKISVDDTNFRKSMENAQKVSKNVAEAMKNLQSPLDRAKSGFNAIAHPVETAKANIEKLKNATESIRHPIETFKNKVADASTALETKRNKLSTLAAGYDSAKKKVEDLTKEFNKSAKESGTSSQKTQELAKKLKEAEKEAEEAKKELDDYSASVSKAGKNSDSASKGVGNFASKLGKGLATAGKIGLAAVGAAAAGITALTTAAVKNYAEYEQLVGGAELLFGDAFDSVMKNADNAYKTVQMSQSEYLRQVNGFSTGLKTALNGNEQAAADLAHKIIQAEADVVAATGTSQEAVQNAFNGIMKSNFSMLDNLQLGITPTKEGFQEVIDKVNEWNKANGEATNYQMGNLADMQSALVDYIEMQGLSGYAAKEAAKTISGSVASMKAAWSNLVTGLAKGNADIGALVDNLVATIVGDGTEDNLGVLGNIMPAVKTALSGAGRLVEEIVPKIVETIPEMIGDVLPQIANSAVAIIRSLADTLKKNGKTIAKSVAEVGKIIITGLVDIVPEIISAGIEMIASLAETLAESADEIESGVVAVVDKIIAFLTDGEAIGRILEASFTIIQALADGIVQAIPKIADALVELMGKFTSFFSDKERAQDFLKAALDIITRLVDAIAENAGQIVGAAVDLIVALAKFLVDPETLKMLGQAAIDIVMSLGDALVDAAVELWNAAVELAGEILDAIWETDWVQVGKDIVNAIGKGMKKAVFGGGASDLVDFAKRAVSGDISGNNVASIQYGGATNSLPTSGVGSLDTSRNRNVVVNQYINSEAKSAADLMQEAIYYQERAELLGV